MRYHLTFLRAAALLLGTLLTLTAITQITQVTRGAEPLAKKTGRIFFDAESGFVETTPFVWKGKLLLLGSLHRERIAKKHDEQIALGITDPQTGEILARFGGGCSFGCAFVDNDTLHVFASRLPETEDWDRALDRYWYGDIVHFTTKDLKSWTETTAIKRDNEHLLNSSVCRDGDGYLMAYETDNPIGFCFKFARSADLERWEKVPDSLFAGPDAHTYSACPVVRRSGDYYYVIYLRQDGRGGFESALIRSKDLHVWEESPVNPVFAADEGEGINNSDIDLCEVDGKTVFCYAVGNQQGWADIREAVYDGTPDQFFAECFPAEEGKE